MPHYLFELVCPSCGGLRGKGYRVVSEEVFKAQKGHVTAEAREMNPDEYPTEYQQGDTLFKIVDGGQCPSCFSPY